MTNKLTLRQEKFCLAYRETGNATEAFRRCYSTENQKPESINRNAKKLMDNAKIISRLQELGKGDMERHVVTINTIAKMLLEDRDFARQCETPAAAVSASMGLAKVYGLLTDKQEVTGKDGGAIKMEQVKADAESFKRRIAGIASRMAKNRTD